MNRYEKVVSRLQPQREQLLTHPLYRRLAKLEDLRVFMDQHVFAVWDFMCLLKALQKRLTCIDTYWRPAENANACRFINEIVLCEESDVDRFGHAASHFELYRASMKACGASTVRIDLFLNSLVSGECPEKALRQVAVPDSVREFVLCTLQLVKKGELCEIAGVFALAREDLLPDLFRNIVDQVNQNSNGVLNNFVYYLNRHIEVDGDEHGPMARSMVESICGGDESKWTLVENAARQALNARKNLWDGVLGTIEGTEDGASVTLEIPTSPPLNLLGAAVQLGWIDGLTIEEISEQTRISECDVWEILGQPPPFERQRKSVIGCRQVAFETSRMNA
jgi:Protein of unknown function (DUF3050)